MGKPEPDIFYQAFQDPKKACQFSRLTDNAIPPVCKAIAEEINTLCRPPKTLGVPTKIAWSRHGKTIPFYLIEHHKKTSKVMIYAHFIPGAIKDSTDIYSVINLPNTHKRLLMASIQLNNEPLVFKWNTIEVEWCGKKFHNLTKPPLLHQEEPIPKPRGWLCCLWRCCQKPLSPLTTGETLGMDGQPGTLLKNPLL